MSGSAKNGRNTGTSGDVRVARVQKNITRASLPSAAPRVIPAGFVDRGAARGYLTGIRKKIDSAKEYPRLARNSGQEGKVRVSFTILEDGQISNLLLLAETPFPVLNQEA